MKNCCHKNVFTDVPEAEAASTFYMRIPVSLCSGIQNQIQMKKEAPLNHSGILKWFEGRFASRLYCAACIFCVLSAAGFWQYFLDAVYAPIQPAKVPRVRIRRRIQAVL